MKNIPFMGIHALTKRETEKSKATTQQQQSSTRTRKRAMKDLSTSPMSSKETTVESSSWSELDFNSEDAYCARLSNGEEGSEVQIIGMDLLLSEHDEMASNFIDESEIDSIDDEVDRLLKSAVDSLELIRKRLPHLIIRHNVHMDDKRRTQKAQRVCFPSGEVDSLILTRERMPHLIHNYRDDAALMIKLFEEGRGLMGEVDSLALDKRRLPHLVLVHESPKVGKKTTSRGEQRMRAIANEEAENDVLPETRFTKLTEVDNDTISLAESSTPSAVDTVDSLILTRRRLASHSTQNYYHTEERCISDDHKTTPTTGNNYGHSKLPDKAGVGLSNGLCRQSSNACAA